MKRYIYFVLVVSLFICYSGFSPEVMASFKPTPDTASSGCHGMSISGLDAESGKTDHTINNSTISVHTCCHDSLLNAPVDDYSAFANGLVYTITVVNLNGDAYRLKTAPDRSPREHGPPDLQISNSVFLL